MKKLLIAILASLAVAGVLWIAADGLLSFVLFWGRLHSLAVHFPIGLLLLSGGLELYRLARPKSKVSEVLILSLPLAAVGSILAVLTGYMLSFEGGFAEETLYWHLRLGVLVAVCATSSLLLRTLWRFFAWQSLERAYQTTLFAGALLLILAGHLGGVLAHGPDYLTAYLPAPARSLIGLAPSKAAGSEIDRETAVLFADVIQPILDHDCGGCHNPSRKRGGLDLSSQEGVLAGGENGEVLTAGEGSSSELILRMALGSTDPKRMPPGDRTPVDLGKVEVIRWWIEQGASFQLQLSQIKDPPFVVTAYLDRIAPQGGAEPEGIFALEVTPPSVEQMEVLAEEGFAVGFLAEGQPFLDVRMPRGTKLTSEARSSLAEVSQQVAWLDLSGTELESGWTGVLPGMTHLVRLNLSLTNAADQDLAALNGLQYLEHLNLYGTPVSDAGLKHLAGLPRLTKLYLWQTRVSEEGVAELRAGRADLEVTLGETLKNADDE
ncbi:MAG: hypothetical protein JSU96_10625 [Acidobacteriota bacterium]|nr:MAG: hypothetical protein JSU96_10625 [Acidobacteriota bacterium]